MSCGDDCAAEDHQRLTRNQYGVTNTAYTEDSLLRRQEEALLLNTHISRREQISWPYLKPRMAVLARTSSNVTYRP
jgi:hypothetical protein